MIEPWAVVAGAVAGTGVALLIRELWPAPPELGPALARLDGTARGPVTERGASRLERWAEGLPRVPGMSVPHRELDLIGQTPGRFLRDKLMLAFLGLLTPTMVGAAVAAMGVSLPFVLPGFAAVLAAALLWFVPDGAVKDQARAARIEFAHAAAAYLELVALERAGDAGPAEALERAAAVGDGWAFRRIRDALARARVAGTDPWNGLRELAAELDLPGLGDVADIIELSGTEGAAVYGTLRERARSLRTELLADEREAANAVSERMVVPGTLLVMVMTVLVGFPAIVRIFTT
jgi:hypothetical protein